ncbi:MAG: ferritin family protein [Candidatus Moraniibacteriota bacterium]
MKTYICEICGDAYIGADKPSQCPFCGAGKAFIKDGAEAKPVVNETIQINQKDRENLRQTLSLEMDAVAIYQCMASKAGSYEIKAMYKRLAKVELEHATIVTKILKIEKPEVVGVSCSDNEIDNFNETIKLEDNATNLYSQFAKEAEDSSLKKFFGALSLVEREHIDLINGYLLNQ